MTRDEDNPVAVCLREVLVDTPAFCVRSSERFAAVPTGLAVAWSRFVLWFEQRAEGSELAADRGGHRPRRVEIG